MTRHLTDFRTVSVARHATLRMATAILCALVTIRSPLASGRDATEAAPRDLAAPDAAVSEMITRAGNVDDDAERLRILRQVRDMPAIDAALKADVEKLVGAVEKWVSSPFLPYFWRVSDTVDFDFGVSRDSPLYPLTCLYRGRMLVWNTLEMGNVINHPELRRKYLDKAALNFRVFRKVHPENRIARMYLGEAIPWAKPLSGTSGAPRWAVLERENLERLTDIILWWIERRMQPDGQYGGGWGDDCEMWRWWTPVLLGFDHPKISAAQARFSKALMSQEHMKHGYTTRMTDVEHTAEDSADAITPMMHLAPESPEWKLRALRLAELTRDLWTGRNDRGFLQFRSTYFTVDRVDETPSRACDTVYHPRTVQPALLLWQRTGDAKLRELFSAWMDTWVDAAARAERGKPAGIVPSAIHWPDGRIGGVGRDWWDPRNHGEPTLYRWPSALTMLNDTLLLTYHMTGDEKYLQPLRSMAAIRLKYLEEAPGAAPAPGSEPWCAARLGLLAPTLAKYRKLSGSREFDELLRKEGRTVGASTVGEERERLTRRLEESARALRVNFEGYTSEVRWTDRVLRFPALFQRDMMFREAVAGSYTPDPGLVYRLVTGDAGSSGYFPMNAVRWRTPPGDIAALVTDSRTDRFSAELFHFGREPRSMGADLYLLSAARYSLTLSARLDGAERPVEIHREELQVEGPVTHVSFTLPARRLVTLRVVPRGR